MDCHAPYENFNVAPWREQKIHVRDRLRLHPGGFGQHGELVHGEQLSHQPYNFALTLVPQEG